MILDTTLVASYLIIPVIMACFIMGYLIKHYTKVNNRYIPIIMIVIGILINICITLNDMGQVQVMTIIGGAFSGLATVGVHEFLATSLGLKKKKNSDPDDYSDNDDYDDNDNCSDEDDFIE